MSGASRSAIILLVPFLAAAANYQSIFGTPTIIAASTVDASGNIWLTGSTSSQTFPVTANALQKSAAATTCGTYPTPPFVVAPCTHGFVAKIDPSGRQMVYATYLGGEVQDEPRGIAVDAKGSAYVTGQTMSATFPVTPGAWQTKFPGLIATSFVTKFTTDGSGLLYSTFLPGGAGIAIAVDAAGAAFVAGGALSTTFITTPGVFQASRSALNYDAFVLKLNPAGSGLSYSTLIGGTGEATATAVAIDTAGNAYVGGVTDSVGSFPVTPGAFTSFGGGQSDAFVTKLNATGTELIYSSVFGGSENEGVQSHAIDANGAVYFGGYTGSADFPVTNGAAQTQYGGGFPGYVFSVGFAGKLSGDGSQMVYATYLGGPAAYLIAPKNGTAVLAGTTFQPIFPATFNALLPCFPAAAPNNSSQFVVQLDAFGALLYSTFATGAVVAVDAAGLVFAASGTTILDRIDISQPPGAGIRCVANAAAYQNSAIAPGEIISLFGNNIASEEASGIAGESGWLATSLAGTRVLIGGNPAPLLYVSPNQINAVVPFEIAGQTNTLIQIETNGVSTLPSYPSAVVYVTPGIFTADGSGNGEAASLNQDGTVNSSANPAEGGSIVSLFLTGCGAMQPSPPDGFIPTAPQAKPVQLIQASIGFGSPAATLLYAGDAPGQVEGVVQVNVQLGTTYTSGPQTISLSVGNTPLPAGVKVTVYVR